MSRLRSPLLLLGLLVGCTSWSSDWDDDDAVDDDHGDDDQADDDAWPDDDDATPGDDDTSSVNHPPTAPVVEVEPPVAMVDEDIGCNILEPSVDTDGDSITYSFGWVVDGASSSVTQPFVPSSMTAEGETWTCIVTPNDGHTDGSFGEDSAYVSGPDPYGYSIAFELLAAGGAAGGTATLEFDYEHINESLLPICATSFQVTASYTYGTSQGDDFWGNIDEVLSWQTASEVGNDCPESWEIYTSDPVGEWQWRFHPHAFVSCDQVASDSTLAGTYLGVDDAGMLQATTGTFDDFCTNVGPLLQSAFGTGPVEAIWLINGPLGALDSLGSWSYFIPPSSANVDYWFLMGMLLADPGNVNEPMAGLQGSYVAHSFWFWIYVY